MPRRHRMQRRARRVLAWRRGLVAGAPLPLAREALVSPRLGMDGAQTLERLLQSVGQRIIGGVHAGEHRVAATLRQFARKQHGTERWCRIEGMITMPVASHVAGFL